MHQTGALSQMGFGNLLAQADGVALAVLLLLLLMAVFSWYYIITKAARAWHIRKAADGVVAAFWEAPSLPDGVKSMEQQRPSVDRLGELVATEPRGAAAGEDDRARDRRSCHQPGRPTSAARDPGTWPSGVRRRTPRRSRSARIAMTYFRLVPVASRNAAGVRGEVAARESAVASRAR